MHVITFCEAAQFKIVAARKNQYGFVGYSTSPKRYLTQTMTITVDESHQGYTPDGYDGQSGTYTQNLDRITGAQTTSGELGVRPSGGGTLYNPGLDLSYIVPGTYTLSSTDTLIVSISGGTTLVKQLYTSVEGPPFYRLTTGTITLSSEYTLGALEADADSLIATVDVSAMPWNSYVYAAGSDTSGWGGSARTGFTGDYRLLFPAAGETAPYNVLYGNTYPTTPVAITNLNAIAWSGYDPGDATSFSTPTFFKAIGYLKMAGEYCVKTYPITFASDGSFTYGSTGCANGQAACGATVTITPPGISASINEWVKAIPGGRCS